MRRISRSCDIPSLVASSSASACTRTQWACPQTGCVPTRETNASISSTRSAIERESSERDRRAREAPDGPFVSYAGTWYEGANRYAYVEPVATDPDYRRRGLGRAAVLEGLRRCAALGATVAYVGSDLAFYRALGFEVMHTDRCWTKHLADA